jgi:SAM-dependent methyltransferase
LRFEVADATDPLQLELLVSEPLDAIICMQAFMTMADINPLVAFARQALKPGGRFVFTMQHPCFNNDHAALDVQRSLNDDFTYRLVLSGYKNNRVDFGETMQNLPARPLYFHRPLEEILGVFFRAGFVMDSLLEPSFVQPSPPDGRATWENLWQIPPVFACRMVLR